MMHTIVTLHSGAQDRVPNSQSYLDLAAEKKPDVVEVDVRRTSDGIAVLHHNPDVRIGDNSLLIKDAPLERLLAVKPGLLTLSQAMEFCHKHKLFMNLDLKETEAADPAISDIRKLDMAKEILFSGCGRKEILYIREHLPHARVLLNVDDEELDCEGDQYTAAVERNVYNASELGCCGLNVNYLYCREEMVSYARTRSLPLMVWTIDNEQEMRRFLKLGVYSITTNRIDFFHRIQKEMTTGGVETKEI